MRGRQGRGIHGLPEQRFVAVHGFCHTQSQRVNGKGVADGDFQKVGNTGKFGQIVKVEIMPCIDPHTQAGR